MDPKVQDISVARRRSETESLSEGPTEQSHQLTNCVGFASPAQNYMQKSLSLDEHFIKHPAATFYVRVVGDSLADGGIQSEDMLIVDRALEPESGRTVVAVVDGEFVVRRLRETDRALTLAPVCGINVGTARELSVQRWDHSAPDLRKRRNEDNTLEIWGVVTAVIHPV